MQPNNNPLAEIGVILGTLGFIAAGTLLLIFGKVDFNGAMALYVLAASVAGINLAIKAPSPTQQAALVQLASQAISTQQAQPAQLVQSPAPVAAPQVVQFNPASSAAATPQANFTTSYNPPTGTITMPQAISTTMANLPAVPK